MISNEGQVEVEQLETVEQMRNEQRRASKQIKELEKRSNDYKSRLQRVERERTLIAKEIRQLYAKQNGFYSQINMPQHGKFLQIIFCCLQWLSLCTTVIDKVVQILEQ